jgi:hypothetical protein
MFYLSNWSAALRDVSWAKHPGHRELVFLSLRHTGELGGRRAFRFLAVASLLSGGELITFRPNRTTVAEAIAYEAKRMREVALQLDLSWAADLPIDEAAVEPPPELQFDDAEGPDDDGEPVDMPHVDEAA